MPKLNTVGFFLVLVFFISCKDTSEKASPTAPSQSSESSVKYAQSFDIESLADYKIITIKNPWPGADKTFTYALVQKGSSPPINEKFDAIVEIPIKSIVVTSTTHIPSLEMLNETDALVGFPNLDFISSEKTRKRISEGKIKELGQNEDINTEILLDLNPDAVVGFAMDGINTTFSSLQRAGIPVLYNADWTENSPLGKAEWIKFFGALFNKEKTADSIFRNIETAYLSEKSMASQAKNKPTVLCGAMYKDVWYMPKGDSWGAQFIADANGTYLWADSKGTGGLSLNLESVLEQGHDADIWIGPGQFTSLESMKNASAAYSQFKAFKDGEVYSYNLKKGEMGGSIYFELAPNRPDLVLKDYIKILHPELLPDYELYFFQRIK